MSEVSSEAVEAAARARMQAQNPDHPITDAAWAALRSRVEEKWMEAALTAALPYLAAHQPARVVPSAEEVRLIVHTALHGVPMHWTARGTAADEVAAAVLALFASQPTVAQVREQVAREIEAASRDDDRWLRTCDDYRAAGWDGNPDDYERMFWQSAHNDAARIARTETKGGE